MLKKRIKKICKICGKIYYIKSINSLVCSDECRLIKHYKKVGISRIRWIVFKRDNFTCQYCGRSPQKHKIVLELEHIKPLSKGGNYSMKNLTTSCEQCNKGKNTDDMSLFFKKLTRKEGEKENGKNKRR